MGTVYLARSIGLAGFARTVAAQGAPPALKDEPNVVAMFLAEARLAARIAHRNVVDVLDVDLIDGEHVIAMRYVEGGSLGGLIRRRDPGSCPPASRFRIVHDTLLGLHAAHEAKSETGEPLHHRPSGRVAAEHPRRSRGHRAAHGLRRCARAGRPAVDARSVKGKLRYLAPEQLAGAEMDRRVDVFAAGIVLWELLAGRSLFNGSSDAAIMHNVSKLRIEPPEGPSARRRRGLPACARTRSRTPLCDGRGVRRRPRGGGRTRWPQDEVAAIARDTFGAEAEVRRELIAQEARSAAIDRADGAGAVRSRADSFLEQHQCFRHHPGRRHDGCPRAALEPGADRADSSWWSGRSRWSRWRVSGCRHGRGGAGAVCIEPGAGDGERSPRRPSAPSASATTASTSTASASTA